jgi:hypothetical protein
MMKDTELQGDLMDEYTAIQEAEALQEAEVREAIADEQELTEADLDDWHSQLLDEALLQEERDTWDTFWNDKERDQL